MRAQDHIVAISLAALAALVAAPAVASPTYPGIVQETLDMPCVPSCTICHRDTSGRLGTVIKPFGSTLMDAYGLVSEDEAGLRSALKAFENAGQMRSEAGYPALSAAECQTYKLDHPAGEPALQDDPTLAGRWVTGDPLWLNGDTDCDGTSDIAELRQGDDPNTKGPGNLCALYGCGASRIDPHPTGDPTAFLAAVGVASLLGAIWRRKARR